MSATTVTTERPVIFSGELVRAILAGKKTVTRRVMKSSHFELKMCESSSPPHLRYHEYARNSGGRYESGSGPFDVANDKHQVYAASFCPYGRVGDRLWVRERCVQIGHERTVGGCYIWPKMNEDAGRKWFDGRCSYAADLRQGHPLYDEPHGTLHPWYMPRWASRLTLEVTGVRAERVQSISEADAVAEGFDFSNAPLAAFAHKWNALNAARGYGWDLNPWVWVVEYRVVPAA